MRTETVDSLLTAPIVAKVLGTSIRSVCRMARDREIVHVRLPHVRGYRFQRAAVDEFIARGAQPSLPEAA